MSRSSPWTFSRFFTNRPQNWSSSSRAILGFEQRRGTSSSLAASASSALSISPCCASRKRDDADATGRSRAQQAAHQLGDVGGLAGVAPVLVEAVLERSESSCGRSSSASARVVAVRRRSATAIGATSACAVSAIGNRQQAALVERGVREADQRLVAAAVVPAQQRRRQVPRGLGEEAVARRARSSTRRRLASSTIARRPRRAAFEREEVGRRQLHLVADDDHLRRAVQRRTASSSGIWLASSKMTTSKNRRSSGSVSETLSGLISQIGLRSRITQPGVAGGQVADRPVAHHLAELVLQLAPARDYCFFHSFSLVRRAGPRAAPSARPSPGTLA